MELYKNMQIEVTVTAIASDGNGVARYNGEVIFIPYTAVGDLVAAKIVKVCSKYAYAIAEQILQPSAQRAETDCALYSKCGGCHLRHISYPAELEAKRSFVEGVMRNIPCAENEVRPTLASPQIEGYRNKVQFPLAADENGRVFCGFYAQRSHRVIECENCRLQPDILNRMTQAVCEWLTENRISVYKEETHRGLARHIYLRHAVTTGRVMLCLVINGKALPHSDEFCRAMCEQFAQIETIVLNHNTKDTNVILGESCTVLYGDGVLHDAMCGVPVQLHPFSFYQVNTRGAEQLYRTAAQLADIAPTDILLDLYCGAGTIGLSMAQNCKQLIGVEIIPQAIESAKRSAEEMGCKHTRFICADAGAAATKLSREGLTPTVIVLDPPRKGCDAQTLQAVLDMKPQRIVMVSCNPATAARDVKALIAGGQYEVQVIQPVDMFPRTKHVETVVKLVRKTPDI